MHEGIRRIKGGDFDLCANDRTRTTVSCSVSAGCRLASAIWLPTPRSTGPRRASFQNWRRTIRSWRDPSDYRYRICRRWKACERQEYESSGLRQGCVCRSVAFADTFNSRPHAFHASGQIDEQAANDRCPQPNEPRDSDDAGVRPKDEHRTC